MATVATEQAADFRAAYVPSASGTVFQVADPGGAYVHAIADSAKPANAAAGTPDAGNYAVEAISVEE